MRAMRIARSLAPAVVVATLCAVAVPPHPTAVVAQSHQGDLTRVARSVRGMVVSSSPIAAQVGMRVLQQGGNAVDAAVATAFALSVVEFGAFGLGGRLQMIMRSADGQVTGIDGTIQVPNGYLQRSSDDGIGYTTIGAPGAVAALGQAHKLHGSKPLRDLLAPAIELAESGWVLTDRDVRTIASAAEHLRRFDGSRRQFFKADGSPYAAGD